LALQSLGRRKAENGDVPGLFENQPVHREVVRRTEMDCVLGLVICAAGRLLTAESSRNVKERVVASLATSMMLVPETIAFWHKYALLEPLG
jgi:hypothetical protein